MPGSTIAGIPDWPFAPGEGPFHVKGGSYRGHRAFMDEHVPGGFAGIVEQLDPALQKFYAQPFLANGWYDLAPLVAMAPICGAALGISPDEYVRVRSKAYVERVLELTKAGKQRVRASEFRPEGEAHGVVLVGFDLEVQL
jgi:hypothetical protein